MKGVLWNAFLSFLVSRVIVPDLGQSQILDTEPIKDYHFTRFSACSVYLY